MSAMEQKVFGLIKYTGFTNIPVEILKKIAGHCVPKDIFELSLTCRHLRDVCDDALVLQDSFRHRIGQPASIQLAHKEAVIKLIRARVASMPSGRAKLIWARFAAAAAVNLSPKIEFSPVSRSLYRHTIGTREHLGDPFSYEIVCAVGLMSTLTVLGYPTINNARSTAGVANLVAHLMDLETWPQSTCQNAAYITFGLQACFCLAIGTLLHPKVSAAYSANTWNSLKEQTQNLQLLHWQDTATNRFMTAYSFCTIAHIASALFSTSQGDHQPPPLSALTLLNVIDRGGNIPLPIEKSHNLMIGGASATSMKSLQPMDHFGASTTWKRWHDINIYYLVQNLERIEWAGYVKSVEKGFWYRLTNIRFRVTSTTTGRVNIVAHDFLGEGDKSQRLTGWIERYSWRVVLYTGDSFADKPSLHHQGAVTPLGIAGYTRNFDNIISHSNFWMYNTEWTHA